MRDEVGWEGGGGVKVRLTSLFPLWPLVYSVVQTGLTLFLSANQSAVCRFKIRNRWSMFDLGEQSARTMMRSGLIAADVLESMLC